MSQLTSTINIADIIKQLQQAQSSANAANEKRYQEGLAALQAGRNELRNTYAGAANLMQDVGRTAMEDVNRGATQQYAQGRQGLISSGLGNTTIQASLGRGVEEDRRRGMERVEEQRATALSGLQERRAGAEYGTIQDIAGFRERRNDIAPDPSMYAGLIQQAAAAGSGQPVTVSGGLGPNARAGMDIFGQPLGGSGGQYSPSGSGGVKYSGGGLGSMSGGGGGGGAPGGVFYSKNTGPTGGVLPASSPGLSYGEEMAKRAASGTADLGKPVTLRTPSGMTTRTFSDPKTIQYYTSKLGWETVK